MSSGNADKMSFVDAIANRRSIYALTKNLPISDTRVRELVETAMKHVPSAFDTQSARLVVLLHAEHDKFWDFVLEVLQPNLTDAEKKKATEGRIKGFRDAAGTILFLEDPVPFEEKAKQVPQYSSHFGAWSEHTSAMHQFALWVALEAEGCGANLQHYNPVVDNKAKEHWGIDMRWQLRAQLVFGGLAEGAREGLKEKKLEGREKGAVFHGLQK